MDINELKKLINEEVNRRRLLKEQEPPERTGAGTPKAKVAQASGQLTTSQQRIQDEKERLITQVKNSASQILSRKDLDTNTRNYLEQIEKAKSPQQIFNIPHYTSFSNPDKEILDLFHKFNDDLNSLRTIDDPGYMPGKDPLRPAIDRLPTRNRRRSDDTTQISPTGPTRVVNQPVLPNDPNKNTITSFKENKRK
jgi:hypothetical protein